MVGRARHFDDIAWDYDRLRPADDLWWRVLETLVREGDVQGRLVLEIGCGTGRMSAVLVAKYGCRVVGLDTSREMLAVARDVTKRSSDVSFVQGRAEDLPFADGSFERTVTHMALHLFSRESAFAEMKRVLADGGKAVASTLDPALFSEHWLARYFPSYAAADEARFPSRSQLEAELGQAGLSDVHVTSFDHERIITHEQAVARIRGRAFSTFDLLPPNEYRAGLERAEAELPDATRYPMRWLIAVGLRRNQGTPKTRGP